MRFFLLCVVVASASAWPHMFSDQAANDPSVAERQQTLNQLLYKVTEPIKFDLLKSYADTFDPIADLTMYDDGGAAVRELMKELNDNRLLQRHHTFSLFNTRQRQEALMLFKVLLFCHGWECAVKNAAFFRERMNEGEFIYAVYTVINHSRHGEVLVLPPMYEVTPHMFTNSEIIQKAYTAQMTQTPGNFHMQFTGTKKNPEQHVAYFGEDLGMNVHHVTWHMDYPFWWDDAYGYHLDRKGELFFWAHHQLTARFDSERLSNRLDMVEPLYWDRPIVEGFAPHTTYRYGGEFPTRPDNIKFSDIHGVIRVRDMIIHEARVIDAIDHGYIIKRDGTHININDEHGIDHLGDIIESSLYSPNPQYYGALHNHAHILLGRQSDPKGKFNLPPSVMEHFETATRDPAFFRLHKYMDGIFKEHKDTLNPYTDEEIAFPGVSVSGVSVDGALETFFEDFEFDLRTAVDSSETVAEVDVKAHVPRLNHKDFALKLDINNGNDRDAHAVIRTYMCPKFDNQGIEFTLESGRWHCIEMDKFWHLLSTGPNHITRKSSESSVTMPDIPSFQKLMQDADAAVAAGTELHNEEHVHQCGMPNRMLLPKGTTDGMDFVLAVIVNDASGDDYVAMEGSHASHSQCGISGRKFPDHRPMGFPYDRKVPDERVFAQPNINIQDVKVFHNEH